MSRSREGSRFRADDGRLRARWRIAVALVVFYLGSMVVGAVAFGLSIGSPRTEFLVTTPLLFALSVALLIVSARYLDRRPLRTYGLAFSRSWWIDFAGGLGLGVVASGLAFAVAYGRGWLRVEELFSPGSDPFVLGFVLFAVGLLAMAVAEEVVFRGIVLSNAAEGLSARGMNPSAAVFGAVIVSSVLFGVLHIGPGTVPEGIPLAAMVVVWTVGGFGYAIGYALTGQLALPIGYHFTSNFAASAIFLGTSEDVGAYFPSIVGIEATASGAFHPVYGLPSVAGTIAGVVGVVGWIYLTRGELSFARSVGRSETT